jgi:hypothetical protein
VAVPPLWFQEDVAFEDGWSYGRKICWLLHRFPRADVQQAWGSQGPFVEAARDYDILVRDHEILRDKAAAFVSAPETPAPAPAASEPEPPAPSADDLTAEELEALHAPSPATTQPRLTAARREAITKLAATGMTAEQIATKLELPLELVRRGMPLVASAPAPSVEPEPKAEPKPEPKPEPAVAVSSAPTGPVAPMELAFVYTPSSEPQAQPERPRPQFFFEDLRRMQRILARLGLSSDASEGEARSEIRFWIEELAWAAEVLE